MSNILGGYAMKKILITIVSIVLIVSVCFALAACDPKDDPTPTTCTQHVDEDNNGKCDVCGATVTPALGEIVTEIPADYQASVAKLQSQAAAWILNNADNKADHAADLNSFIDSVRKTVCKADIKKVATELKDGKYNVTLTFTNNKRYIMTLDTVVNNDTYVAGTPYKATTDLTFDNVFTSVYNALMDTIKAAIANGSALVDASTPFEATIDLGVAFRYGTNDDGSYKEPVSAGLRVSGAIGLEAKDTHAAIEVVVNDTVMGGLYYIGAANKADCKLFLDVHVNTYNVQYYIDNADLNALIGGLLAPAAPVAAGEADADPFAHIASFNAFLSGLNLDSTISSAVTTIVDMVLTGHTGVSDTTNGKLYQVEIDLASLLDAVGGLIGDMIDFSEFPEPFDKLNLSQLHGLNGKLVLSVGVDNTTGLLNGVELGFNIPQQDLRLGYEDNTPKVFGPVNAALIVKDFAFDATKPAIDINEYTYFSPLDASAMIDFTISEAVDNTLNGTYQLVASSKVNPFDLENGDAAINVTKDGDIYFLNIFFDFFTNASDGKLDSHVKVYYNGTLYTTTMRESTLASQVGGYLLSMGTNQSAITPVVEYVTDLMNQLFPATTEPTTPVEPPVENPTVDPNAKGPFDDFNAMGIIDIITGAEDVIDDLKNTNALDYSTEELYLHLDLDYTVYNKVLALLRKALPNLPTMDENAATVKVDVNYAPTSTTNQLKVVVSYKDVNVVVYGTINDWDSQQKLSGYVEVTIGTDKTTYALSLDAANFATTGAVLKYTVAKGDAAPVDYVDILVKQNDLGGVDITAKLYTDTDSMHKLHLFELSAYKTVDGYYTLSGTANGQTVIAGFKPLTASNTTKTLAFGIPSPAVAFGVKYDFNNNGNDYGFVLDVTNAQITGWGINVNSPSNMIPADPATTVDSTAFDSSLLTIITDILNPYLFATVAE